MGVRRVEGRMGGGEGGQGGSDPGWDYLGGEQICWEQGKAPSEVDFWSHYRKYETFWPNCQIEQSRPKLCTIYKSSSLLPHWQHHISQKHEYDKPFSRKMQWWDDDGLNCKEWMEGREVLPIKADGDGFAQEVRLHLFYSNQSNAFFSWWPGNLRPGQGLVAI